MTSFSAVRAVLLDLDGTLLDTASEIAAAAADMLADLRLDPVPAATVRGFIGKGIPHLVGRTLEASLGRASDDRQTASGLESFLSYYAKHNGRQATAYPGVREGLTTLHAGGLALGCVTNKSARFTLPLLGP